MIRAGGGGGSNTGIRRAFVRLSANQLIASGGAGTIVEFDEIINDPFSLYKPATFEFENSCNYNFVRFTIGIGWQANAAGIRTVEQRVAGIWQSGCIADYRDPTSAGATALSAQGGWVNCVSNETNFLAVTQTSGIDLNLQALKTWCLFECATATYLNRWADSFVGFGCTGP